MSRLNEKVQLINYENSIKKSNELSMAKLNQGLSLNQMQLLAYAIFSTQQDGKSEFHKAHFEKKFGINQYRTLDAKKDALKLTSLHFATENLEEDSFSYINIFSVITYTKGLFEIDWNTRFLPHILGLKEKYVTTDLSITANFKSSFSWTLYDYLKAHYGYWHKLISKNAALKLFGVENKKTYQSTSQFKRGVLDVAIAEINQYTEFEVWYKEEKKGRSIIGFDLYWSAGKQEATATQMQIKELKTIIDGISDKMLVYINVSDDRDRLEAIKRFSKVRDFIQYTIGPVSITKHHANNLIILAKDHLCQLELILQRDIENKQNKSPEFYNWLEERE